MEVQQTSYLSQGSSKNYRGMSDLQRYPAATAAQFETIYVHMLVRHTNKAANSLKEFGGAARI